MEGKNMLPHVKQAVAAYVGCQLLLITNRKSHTCFRDWYRPRWPWMTLNAVIALILRFLRNSTDFQADYITVVEDRPITSVLYCLPVPIFYFWRKL